MILASLWPCVLNALIAFDWQWDEAGGMVCVEEMARAMDAGRGPCGGGMAGMQPLRGNRHDRHNAACWSEHNHLICQPALSLWKAMTHPDGYYHGITNF